MNGEDAPPQLAALLRAAGMGVASFDTSGDLAASNKTFRDISLEAPGAALAMRLRAIQEGRPVESLRFEPRLGWLRWLAHPLKDGVAVQVCRATEEELRAARLADQVAGSGRLPTRAAMNVDIEMAWHTQPHSTLMLLEPSASPRELPLSQADAGLAMVQVAAFVSARLIEGEGVYLLSPLTLALFSTSRHGRRRMADLLSLAQGVLSANPAWAALRLAAGCASLQLAANPQDLYRQAGLALLSHRLSPSAGPLWSEDQ